jgi:hypothetical protein
MPAAGVNLFPEMGGPPAAQRRAAMRVKGAGKTTSSSRTAGRPYQPELPLWLNFDSSESTIDLSKAPRVSILDQVFSCSPPYHSAKLMGFCRRNTWWWNEKQKALIR